MRSMRMLALFTIMLAACGNKESGSSAGEAKETTGSPTKATPDKAPARDDDDSRAASTTVPTTLRELCVKVDGCGCNQWKTVDGCTSGLAPDGSFPDEVVACIGKLSCSDICKSKKPEGCVSEWAAAASEAERSAHETNMNIINNMGGDNCPPGYHPSGGDCVSD